MLIVQVSILRSLDGIRAYYGNNHLFANGAENIFWGEFGRMAWHHLDSILPYQARGHRNLRQECSDRYREREFSIQIFDGLLQFDKCPFLQRLCEPSAELTSGAFGQGTVQPTRRPNGVIGLGRWTKCDSHPFARLLQSPRQIGEQM